MKDLSVELIDDIVKHHEVVFASSAVAGAGSKRLYGIFTGYMKDPLQKAYSLTYVVWCNGSTRFSSNNAHDAIEEYNKIKLEA